MKGSETQDPLHHNGCEALPRSSRYDLAWGAGKGTLPTGVGGLCGAKSLASSGSDSAGSESASNCPQPPNLYLKPL